MYIILKCKYSQVISAALTVLWFFCFLAVPAHGVSFDCKSNRCGLKGDGSYQHLVIGTVKINADEENSTAVYNWAREHGYWADLPDDQARFLRSIQIVSVEVPSQDGVEEITLLMGREDFDAIQIKAGDLVRYRPHEPSYSAARALPASAQGVNRAYWNLFGCIAVLCREDDGKCPQRYSTGVYRLSDGVALNRQGEAVADLARRIDLTTYLPIVQGVGTR
jgi:hypothetical protein